MAGAPPFRGFLIDADNTIFDYDRAEREALSATLAEVGLEPAPTTLEAYRRINDGLWMAFERGEVTQEQLKADQFRKLLSEVLCVGDVPATDVRGARAAGMASCWVAAAGVAWHLEELEPDYTISDLRELASLAPPVFP